MRSELAIDADLNRIETQHVALFDCDEYGDLRVGGIEQLFFESIEFCGNAEHIGFYFLYLLVQAFHLRTVTVVRETDGPAQTQQNGAQSHR
jgi:hypothetical protein